MKMSKAMRSLLQGTVVATTVAVAMSTASFAQAPQNVLRVVPQSDFPITDPLFGTAWISVIHGTMVWESLFAWDSNLQPKPQMVSEWGVSDDGLTWQFTLRDDLRFHDGSDVEISDVIASLRRWMQIDATAKRVAAITEDLSESGPKTLTWKLSKPFPSLLDVLAAVPSRFPAIMRAEDIPTDGKPATSVIGSGPFRYIEDESLAGAKRVYEKNEDYVPRSEPADGLSGGRVVKVDRVEWQIIPDSSTAVAALQSGEIDFMERPALDLVPQLRQDDNIVVRKLTDLSGQAILRPNTIHPPFDNVKARQALNYLVDQPSVLTAGYGDPENWGECNSFFICGTPNATTAGAEDFHYDLEKAKELLAEAGYKGEKIVFHSTHELPQLGNMAEVVVDSMRKAGMDVDLQWGDWATTIARSANRALPEDGGWNIYATSAPGPLMWSPNTNIGVNTSCDGSNFAGWPCDEEAETMRRAYLETSESERPALMEKLHKRLAEIAPYRVLGQYDYPVAYQKSVEGVLGSPILVFWSMEK